MASTLKHVLHIIKIEVIKVLLNNKVSPVKAAQ